MIFLSSPFFQKFVEVLLCIFKCAYPNLTVSSDSGTHHPKKFGKSNQNKFQMNPGPSSILLLPACRCNASKTCADWFCDSGIWAISPTTMSVFTSLTLSSFFLLLYCFWIRNFHELMVYLKLCAGINAMLHTNGRTCRPHHYLVTSAAIVLFLIHNDFVEPFAMIHFSAEEFFNGIFTMPVHWTGFPTTYDFHKLWHPGHALPADMRDTSQQGRRLL